MSNRMSLKNVVGGKLSLPDRIVLFGPDGIGKSSTAGEAPKPIFLGSEDGTARLDVSRFPEPSGWEDILGAVETLIHESHDYETFVLDTIDWAEPLCWDFVCKRDGKSNIEDYGYHKGYVTAVDQWRVFLHKLDALRKQRSMRIILLGHSVIKLFKNPQGDDYDRYEMKMEKKAAALVREWADCVLFANYETFTRETAGRVKGIDNGARVIYTERRAAYDAKNRQGLPSKMPLSWSELDAALSKGQEDLGERYETLLGQIEDESLKATIEAGFKKAREGKDKAKMAILVNWMKGKIE